MGEVHVISIVGEMVQNSQSLYSFTFTAVIVIHEYIYSHSTTKFTFKKYICLHLTTYFSFTNIFTHICGMYRSHSMADIRSHSRSKYSFNTVQYSFNIFCALPLRIVNFAPFRQPLLSGSNGFHVMAWSEILTVVGSYCHQNLKPENFTSSFGGPRQKVARLEHHDPSLSFDHIIDLWRCRLTPTS